MSMVDKNAPGGCWLWVGSVNKTGYGQFCVEGTKPVSAHRAALLFLRGIPMVRGRAQNVDHLCRNRRCVNPDHLEVVTQAENVRRGMIARHGAARKPTCAKGHPLTDGNVYGKHRRCSACHNEAERRRRQLGIASVHKNRKAPACAEHVEA